MSTKLRKGEPMKSIRRKIGLMAHLIMLISCATAIAEEATKKIDVSQRIINGIIDNIYVLLPALIGLAILCLDLKLRWNIHKLRVKEHEERMSWLKQESIIFDGVSREISDKVASELRSNTRWAQDALERAKLGPYAQTVFGERLNHFREEKATLCEHFTPILFDRCRRHVDSGKHVFLVIDSGTTLFPFFEKFGADAVTARFNEEDWMKSITLVTNNLSGVESLIRYGRVQDRHSSLEIRCHLLPGTPLPIYSALTGRATNSALRKFAEDAGKDAKKQGKNAVFVGLVTGNWIRISETTPPCPVPLARGEGHLEFKTTLISCCDEVYVVAPLGKVFVNTSNRELNDALGFQPGARAKDNEPYSEIDGVDNKMAAKLRLISTSRTDKRLLFAHSAVVENALGHSVGETENFVDISNFPYGCHLMFPFDDLPDDPWRQFMTEFPHPATRKSKLFQERFQVSMSRPTRSFQDRF